MSKNNKSFVIPGNLSGASRSEVMKNCKAIVLAGGNGFPGIGPFPADLINRRPAHFSRNAGGEITIDQARKQIARAFEPKDTMFVVSEPHKPYYEEVLADVPQENLIVQPEDLGTTLAVFYAVLRLAMTNPSAILTFFPADFNPPNPGELMYRVRSAAAFVRQDPNLILIGIKPDNTLNEGEWIEADSSAPVDKILDVWRVRRFLTDRNRAKKQFKDGALLNSSVMTGSAATFLRKIRNAAPEIYDNFSLAAERIGTVSEQRSVRAAYYSQYAYTDFSRDVLEKSAEKLLVVPVPALLKKAVGIKPKSSAQLADTVIGSPPKYFTAQVGA